MTDFVLVRIEASVYDDIEKLAKEKGLSIQTAVNTFLIERINDEHGLTDKDIKWQ